METLIDLTHSITNLMPIYPGDDETTLRQTRQLQVHKYNNHKLETGMHSGTHIDGPMHLTEREVYISEFPLERFMGSACIFDARGQEEIKYKSEYEALIEENDIVLFYTGFDEKFGSEQYFHSHPLIDITLAQLLVRKKIKILGIDWPSPDRYPFSVHQLLFENGIFIIENLTNMKRLLDAARFEIIAFPLKINADSSILRAVARIPG